MEVTKHGNQYGQRLKGKCEVCKCEFTCFLHESKLADHDPDAVAYANCPECSAKVDLDYA